MGSQHSSVTHGWGSRKAPVWGPPCLTKLQLTLLPLLGPLHLFSQTLVVFLRSLPELAGNGQCVRASLTRNTHTGTLLPVYLQ